MSKSIFSGPDGAPRASEPVLAVNLMGDWLRDHLDPKLRQSVGRAAVPDTAAAASIGPAVGEVPAARGAAAAADGG
jgi:hypothetical protein